MSFQLSKLISSYVIRCLTRQREFVASMVSNWHCSVQNKGVHILTVIYFPQKVQAKGNHAFVINISTFLQFIKSFKTSFWRTSINQKSIQKRWININNKRSENIVFWNNWFQALKNIETLAKFSSNETHKFLKIELLINNETFVTNTMWNFDSLVAYWKIASSSFKKTSSCVFIVFMESLLWDIP